MNNQTERSWINAVRPSTIMRRGFPEPYDLVHMRCPHTPSRIETYCRTHKLEVHVTSDRQEVNCPHCIKRLSQMSYNF